MMSGERQELWKKRIVKASILLGGLYAVMRHMAKKQIESESIDQENPYISSCGNDNQDCQRQTGDSQKREARKAVSIYRNRIKPFLDRLLSFMALILLAPVFAVIALAVYADDPGPVFFTQTRVGRNKKFFSLHKFRSMKMSTPHDVPTHQLENPEQYITKVGRILRKTSLDELPQIWDIFRGKMSIIGPRPALWNQEDLVAEREKYGANDVMPGLTGWAQINGRDELEIEEKARLDGEYVLRLNESGGKAFWRDICCFFGTIYSVFMSDGIVEGGTNKLKMESFADFDDVETYPIRKKKILITGAESYIGDSVKRYLEKEPKCYSVDVLNTLGIYPTPNMFVGYDVVFNVAGIAHKKETNENRFLFYEINRDMVISIARAAKVAGVSQFILLSSMSVYGINNGKIEKKTVPFPNSAYGESKLAADEAVEQLSDRNFKVAVLRPPMVYGEGCKGNYQILRNFVLKSHIFPSYKNQRSMIYIGNLCEFVKRTIDQEKEGLFFPQDREYVNTTEMVKKIADNNGRKILFTNLFNPLLKILPLNIVKKVFGSLYYEKVDTVGKYDFEKSMEETENRKANTKCNQNGV